MKPEQMLAASYDPGTQKDKYNVRTLSTRNYNKSVQAGAEFISSTKGCILAEKFKAGAMAVLGCNDFVERRIKKTNQGVVMLIICDKYKIESWKRKIQTHSTTKFKIREVCKDKEDRDVPGIIENFCWIVPWSMITKHDEIKDRDYDVLIVDGAEKCGSAELSKASKRGSFVVGNEESKTECIKARKKIFIVDIIKLFKAGPLPLYPIMRACLPGIKMTRTKFINRFCAPEWKACYHTKEGTYERPSYLKENKAKDETVFLELQWMLRTNGLIRRQQKDVRAQWAKDMSKEELQDIFNLKKGRTRIIKDLVDSPIATVRLYDPRKQDNDFEFIDETDTRTKE